MASSCSVCFCSIDFLQRVHLFRLVFDLVCLDTFCMGSLLAGVQTARIGNEGIE